MSTASWRRWATRSAPKPRRVRWLVGLALLAGPAAAQTLPGTFLARVEAQALLATLNAELLSHDSATSTLERWCGVHRLAADPRIHAQLQRGLDQPPTETQRRELGVGPDEPVRYRRVRLSCGDRVLSESDNWYVPRLLTPEMNRLLDETDTPFGRAVLALSFQRHTLAAELLWQPLPAGWEMSPSPAPAADTPVPPEVLRHRAVLTTRDGLPFCEVVETYQAAMFDFPLPR